MNTKFRLLPDSASNFAGDVDKLTLFLTVVSVIITLVVCGLIAFFAIKYRRRHVDDMPPREEPGRWTEILWSAVLFVLLMVMFFWGAEIYMRMKRPAPNATEINVTAKRWMWKIQHPSGQREINELHIPVGQPVKLTMISEDVIHSFSVPAFRIKQDVIPGSYSTQWFTPTKVGEYHLFCQEYCGTLHSDMIGRVVVMEEKDYQAWLAGVSVNVTPVEEGAKLFATYGCLTCHGQNAPSLAGLFGRQQKLDDGSTVLADEEYLRESIINPAAKVVAGYGRLMPSFRAQLSDEQVSALVSYIKTLGAAKSDEPGQANSAAPATQPVNGVPPNSVPNLPPAAQPPGVWPQPSGEN